MVSLTNPISIDSRLLRLYRPLIRNLIIIIGGAVLLAGTALVYFDEQIVRSLSERLIERTNHATDQRVERLFGAAREGLVVVRGQIERLPHLGNEADREALFETFRPFFDGYPLLNSTNVAYRDGSEFAMIRRERELLTRFVSVEAPLTAEWTRRVDGLVVERWQRTLDEPPTARPWFVNAYSVPPKNDALTGPYTFLTTREVGLSLSQRSLNEDSGMEFVVAFNIDLGNVSAFTMSLRPTPNALTVVFDEQQQTLGLPADPRYASEEARLAEALTPLNELGIPAISAAAAAWKTAGGGDRILAFRTPEDRTAWWAGFTRLHMTDSRNLWAAVLIPKDDLIGTLARARNLSLAGIVLTGLLLATGVFLTSMRRIRRQVNEAVESIQKKLGNYQILEKLGAGGNGTVYRARHTMLRRPTAIKLMNASFSDSAVARERFRREVELTSSLTHPNTISIYDYGTTPDGTMYYVMEYLDGRTLEQVVRISGPQPAARVVQILAQMAGALAEAHGRGLVHRDIKPSNAILCERGGVYDVVKVLDFGLVQETAIAEATAFTEAGVIVGTPMYMAPESITTPGAITALCDIYALGAVGYYLLTGRTVFEGDSIVDICAHQLYERPIPPSERSGLPIPVDLEAVILRCLAKKPEDRPAGAAALREELLQCEAAETWTQADAAAWWRRYASIDEPDTEMREGTTRSQVAIDLGSRALNTRG